MGYRDQRPEQCFHHLGSAPVPSTVPRLLTVGFILPRAQAPSSECFSQPPALARTTWPKPDQPRQERLTGFRVPHRDDNVWCPPVAPASQADATFRPRRFSRPRRVTPPRALWVCFTPQPRPGFSLQGIGHTAEPHQVIPGRCLLAVEMTTPVTEATPATPPSTPRLCSPR